jgi:ABC-type antimicrobial peptide transport system permease subunit
MVKNFFKTALRRLFRSKTTSFINISCLTVGMTTTVLILLWVQNELNYDNYHPGSKEIFRVTMHHSDSDTSEYSSLLLADAAKTEIPAIKKTARLFTASFYNPSFLYKGERIIEKNYAYVDEGWFELFHYEVIEGSTVAFGNNPFSLILTRTTAEKYFGNYSAVGRFIQIDSVNYQVQAVIKDNPTNSSFQFDVWLPNAAYLADVKNRQNEESWNSGNYLTFIQLEKNANPLFVSKQLSRILNRNAPDSKSFVSLLPLKDIHFEKTSNSGLVHGNRSLVFVFSLMAVLILITACINYITLTSAQAALRAKEVSVSKILGAKRKHLFLQFLVDSSLVSVFALLLTLVLVQLLLPVFNSITEKNFSLPLNSVSMWRVIILTFLCTILMSSIYPAVLLSGFSPLAVFRGTGILHSKKAYFSKSLVVVQFTLSIGFIISAIVIVRQLNLVWQTDKNYNRPQIFSVALPTQYLWFNYTNEERINLAETFKKQLASYPGIEAVAIGRPIIDIKTYVSGNIDWEGHDKNKHPVIASLNVDADFQKIFNLKTIQGRWFETNNKTDEHNFILNETALQEFNLRMPVLGQRFVFGQDTGMIIGVVKDFHYSSLHNKIAPLILHNKPGTQFTFLIKASSGAIPQALQSAKAEWKKLMPTQSFNYSFIEDAFNKLYRADKKLSGLVSVFAVITIVISAFGLFGLAAFSARQRVKEIGVRKVLGATVSNILNTLSRDFLKIVLIAFIIACPIAWIAMNKWLQDFAYRINISWWIFFLTGTIALTIAFLAVGFHAIKAAVSNPVKSLRTE